MLQWYNDIKFAYPGLLWLLILVPALVILYFYIRKRFLPQFKYSQTDIFKTGPKGWRTKIIGLPLILRLLAISSIIIVLARPQNSSQGRDVNTEGIDLMVALDISGSMLAEDFKPNRMEAAKDITKDFIESRPNDRLGLVIFAGESFTQCPLTTDHEVLLSQLKGVNPGIFQDGTAVGDGLGTAVARIKDSKAKSKVVILLTDGVNNMGSVAPLTAAEIAKTYGVRVYTIGVGTMGLAPYPMQTPFGIRYQNVEVQIDEPVMKKIADITGGQYFRATGNKKLKEVYKEIDKLERTKIKVTEYSSFKEEFLPFAIAACVLLLLEWIIRYWVLKRAI